MPYLAKPSCNATKYSSSSLTFFLDLRLLAVKLTDLFITSVMNSAMYALAAILGTSLSGNLVSGNIIELIRGTFLCILTLKSSPTFSKITVYNALSFFGAPAIAFLNSFATSGSAMSSKSVSSNVGA